MTPEQDDDDIVARLEKAKGRETDNEMYHLFGDAIVEIERLRKAKIRVYIPNDNPRY